MIIPGSEGSVPVGSFIVGLVLVGCRGTGALTLMFVGSLREGVLYDLCIYHATERTRWGSPEKREAAVL